MCVALKQAAGVRRVEYLAEPGHFVLAYDPGRIGMDSIFALVRRAGQPLGRVYEPQLIT